MKSANSHAENQSRGSDILGGGKYDTQVKPNLKLVEKWARDGATDLDIAKRLGIGETTLYKYKKLHPDFAEALVRGKEVVDTEVENSLLKRALGYEAEETTEELIGGKLVVTKRVKKHISPDTTAMIFWLKNRLPGTWRNKEDVQLNIDEKDMGVVLLPEVKKK